jgi:hypothetical protein
MKNDVFRDVTSCGSCKNRRFGGTSASFIRVTRIGELGTTLAVSSNRRTLRRTRQVPPILWFLQEPHGVTSQKTLFFIGTEFPVLELYSNKISNYVSLLVLCEFYIILSLETELPDVIAVVILST